MYDNNYVISKKKKKGKKKAREKLRINCFIQFNRLRTYVFFFLFSGKIIIILIITYLQASYPPWHVQQYLDAQTCIYVCS